MKTINIFKTDVRDQAIAMQIVRYLQAHFAGSRFNFDLDDCDNILRVESPHSAIAEPEIQAFIANWGHYCEPLPD